MLKPFNRALPRVVNAANNVLKPIVDRGYSRYDAENGNQMPYLHPTDGLPRLVKPAKVTDSFKAIPNASAPSRQQRSANRLNQLRTLTRSLLPGRDRKAAAERDVSSTTEPPAASE